MFPLRLKLPTSVVFSLLLFCAAAQAQVPASKHVVLVVEENHSYSSVIGSSSMPYLNSLASKYTVAKDYYANTHPSIGNYFMLTTGQIITNSDGYTGTVTADNIVRRIITAGKTWKSYAESIPSTGYIGGDSGRYCKHHNPFAYLSDVVKSSNERQNLVSFNQFKTDRANGQLPNFSFVVPNKCNDAHDCSLSTADGWLKTNIAPLLSTSAFQSGGDGILVILFDESTDSDGAHGGGHVAAVVVGPRVKRGYKSTTFFQHQATLKTALRALGISTYPGASASAPSFTDIF
jgi:phosphatidylinositol-3-phosphatase